MAEYKIYVLGNNNEWGILDTEDIQMESIFSVNELNDLSTRKDTVTKTIRLKGTKNNNRIFGNLFNTSRLTTGNTNSLFYNYNPNLDIPIMVYEGTVLLYKGRLKMNSITRDKDNNYVYEANITGNVVDFWSKLGELKLSDLDFSEYDHTLNASTIQQSFTNTSGYTYPLIDYGKTMIYSSSFSGGTQLQNGQPIEKVDYRNFRPSIFVKTYIDKIFNKIGFKYNSSFLNQSDIKKLIIPCNDERINKKYQGIQTIAEVGAMGYLFNLFEHIPTVITPWEVLTQNNSDLHYVSIGTTVPAPDKGIGWLEFKTNQKTDVKYNIKYTISQAGGSTDPWSGEIVEVGVYKRNLSGYFELDSPLTTTNKHTSNVSNQVATFDIPFQDFQQGEVLGLFFKLINVQPSSLSKSVFISSASFSAATNNNVIIESEYGYNTQLKMNDCVPQNITLKDFLKSLITMFNLYLWEDKTTGEIRIEEYDVFYNQFLNLKTNAVNWSKKIDYNSPFEIKTTNQIPKSYLFTYKSDEDYFNKQYFDKYGEIYGQKKLIDSIGNTTEKKVELVFSPTIETNSISNTVTPTIFKLSSEGIKSSYKHNLRILYYNGYIKNNYVINLGKVNPMYKPTSGALEKPTGYTFTSYALFTSGYPSASAFYLSSTTSTNFERSLLFEVPKEVFYVANNSVFNSKYLYEEYYKNNVAQISNLDSFILSCKASLNEYDVNSLDFGKPVYIGNDDGNGYYKLQSVNYSNSELPSTITLLKY